MVHLQPPRELAPHSGDYVNNYGLYLRCVVSSSLELSKAIFYLCLLWAVSKNINIILYTRNGVSLKLHNRILNIYYMHHFCSVFFRKFFYYSTTISTDIKLKTELTSCQ